LNFAAAYFRNAQRAGALPQNGVSCLDDFKFHGIHNFRSRGNAAPLSWILFQFARIYVKRAATK
jgi:hypothetical protein